MKQEAIIESILSAAEARGSEKTFCPSEIARELFPKDWRAHMQEVINVAISLQNQGKVLITQKGKAIDLNDIKGPIRIRKT